MITSEKGFAVTFKRSYLRRLGEAPAAKVAVLVTNEYEGLFRNGGIGTYYRKLSEQLTGDGWHVILLLPWTEKGFAGTSEFPAVKHIFATCETTEVLNLLPVHREMLSGWAVDAYAHQSACCLLFIQALLACFAGRPVFIEFPDVLGMGYHTIHAKRAGLLGPNCITAVTMHGCHEWVHEASEKHAHDYPTGWLWQATYCDSFGFENADLSLYPSHFLLAKVESYGWNTSRAVHMPYFVPRLDAQGSVPDDLATVGAGKVPVVFFGRLEERKGLCTFVEALGALPPAVRRRLHVLFVGKIIGLLSAPLAHLDSREYIEQTVSPEVSYSILPDLYSAQALGYIRALPDPVVCLASPQENFPNTGLEMGQLPVKLVVSDTGGFRETLELVQRSSGVYWFEPKSSEALAESLGRALADEGVVVVGAGSEDIERTNRALLARKTMLIQQALARAGTVQVERPRVSVAVLWQGETAALLEGLASIEAQTYTDLDVIVVENGGDEGEAREAFERARALFSRYRFVRPLGRLSAGAAWNHALELADGGYYLGLEAGTILAPFAVAHLIKAAGHAQATIVSCPARARATGEEIPGFSGGPLPRLMETALRGSPCFLGAVAFLRRFRRLGERDALTHGWEVLAAAVATGEPIAYYPYALWESGAEGRSEVLDEAARLKQQYQLRQYVAQIPPAQWSPRQLSLLLTAAQHLQAQGAAAQERMEREQAHSAQLQAHLLVDLGQLHATHAALEQELAHSAQLYVQLEQEQAHSAQLYVQLEQEQAHSAQLQVQLRDGHGQLQATHAALEQTRGDLHLARSRITAMESSKFWWFRRVWFRIKRALHIPASE